MIPLLEQLITRCQNKQPVALCTLVAAKGSTPQEAGAKMLVLENGQTVGTLGGGCVEAEVRREALLKIATNQSQLLSFKLDHDYGWDDGLICGGTMDIYIQILSTAEHAAPFQKLAHDIRHRIPTEFRLTFPTPSGEQTYIEPIAPTPILLIAGAGHVGQALATLAADLDFQITILDDRPDYASPARFPKAHQHLVGNIEQEIAQFPIDPFTYIVIVTRGHRRDGHALAAVVRSPARYIGLIGSRRKILTILTDLAQQGVPTELLTRVHAPIGLAIGAVTVPEIAISIASELVAIRRGRDQLPAHPLQLPPEMLHAALHRHSPKTP